MITLPAAVGVEVSWSPIPPCLMCINERGLRMRKIEREQVKDKKLRRPPIIIPGDMELLLFQRLHY